MTTPAKEMLFEASEQLLQTIHLNRTANMAVDYFDQSCTREGIEAVQATLRQQEEMLKKLFDTLGNIQTD